MRWFVKEERLPAIVQLLRGHFVPESNRNPKMGRCATWLMLTVLGGLAEFERELIRDRRGEGRERAEERGVKMGRKPK